MIIAKNKTAAIAIALFLVSAMAISLVALPAANAQTSKKTYAYIGATPNPVGVGQGVLLHVGISDVTLWPQTGWTGLTVTVTKPDGTTETLGPIATDTTGGTGYVYMPNMAGNYTLQTHFPEQTNTVAAGYPVGTVFEASSSEKLTLIVQEEPIPYYPASPLPTEYWTRPINAQLREWNTISGDWLATVALMGSSVGTQWIAPYNDGPESPHILWSRPIGDTMGGLAGGSLDGASYGMGDAYEGKWSGSIIISGVLYYNKFESGQPHQQVVAVDLHTGKELWTKDFNNSRIAFGQVLNWASFNYMGAFSYLWTTSGGGYTGLPESWYAYEPLTGEWRYTMTNVPSGTNIYGPNGEICRYTINLAQGWMTFWNSTTVVLGVNASGADLGSWGSKVHGVTYDATRGIEWNKTLPAGLPGSARVSFLKDRLIGSYNDIQRVIMWGVSLKPGQEGTLMFNNTWKAPADWAAGNLTFAGMSGGWVAWSLEDKVGVLSIKETRSHYAFSLDTGQFLWGPTPSQVYLDMYFGDGKLIAYGKLYSANVGGIVYCYNVTTGKLLWTYAAKDPYTEFQFSSNWWLEPMFVTGGKIYFGHAEHSPNNPRPRGAPFICLNATTGEVIWRANGLIRETHWGGLAIIGDSIIATMDTYDQQIYAIGKGPSATTVTAPGIGVTAGDSLVITGTVTDISPGTEEYALRARFPNGVPAVSDESMTDWMLYVYQQFARPANATGVEVTLDAIDSNGNFVHLGTVTSDTSGTFGLAWETPDVPGKYTIIATFAGSKSYYASYAETYAVVTEAPAASPTPTPTPLSAAEQYFMPMSIGMIVAIVVVGALLALLMLRKRP